MAIIGISGYAGSGKDTVGRIIQYLQCANVGKLTLEEILKNVDEHDWWLSEQSGWEIKKWSGKLKTIASILTGIEEKNFEDQEFKKTYLPEEWNYYTISLIDNGKLLMQHGTFSTKEEAEAIIPMLKQTYGVFRMEYVVGMKHMSVREFLQKLGTDAIRNGLHPTAWVNALMADYKPINNCQQHSDGLYYTDEHGENEVIPQYPNWIITDSRFTNDAKVVKDAGGIMIRVDRPGVIAVNEHPSEIQLDDYNFDYKILNGSDLVSLMFTVHNILKKEKILQ
jgi:hypothetical protein